MESRADRYRRLRTAFAARIADVPPGRWEDPSPCEGWTALDVVRHVIETQHMFEQLVGRALRSGPSVDDDPYGAFLAATDQVQAHLDDPRDARVEYDGYFGRTTFEESVDGFLSMDLVVHAWDLCRATGQDDTIAPADVAWVWSRVDALQDTMRGPNTFGPAVEPEPGADDQDRLLAFLGRVPRVTAPRSR